MSKRTTEDSPASSADPANEPEVAPPEPDTAGTAGEPAVEPEETPWADVPEPEPEDGSEDLRDERIIALEAIIEDLRDKQLRAAAEVENIRRRSEREKADALKFGSTRLARDLLAVADNLSRALSTISDETRAASGDLVTGLELTERELMAAFRRHEIVPIEPKGARFDPNLHEAMAQIPGTGEPEGTVVDVIQTGYQIHGRLLRPARVAIAVGAPEKAGKPEDKETPDEIASEPKTT